MVLRPHDGVEVSRVGKRLEARFSVPHRVASTSPHNGGVRDDLLAVYNRQCCEPAGHDAVGHQHPLNQAEQHLEVCREMKLSPDKVASMGTAATMHCCGTSVQHHEQVVVAAVATAGVEGNAGRAGDPAGIVETTDGYHATDRRPRPMDETQGGTPESAEDGEAADGEPVGTINVMLLSNTELTVGASVRAVMMGTEAKTSILQELRVGSRYSHGSATGTGTDQMIVASRITGEPLSGAGKHTVMGEMIGLAVRAAVTEALRRQNSLTPGTAASVEHLWRRFGVQRERLVEVAATRLTEYELGLLCRNIEGVLRDPLTVAAVSSMATVVDDLRSGMVSTAVLPEVLSSAAALVRVHTSGGVARFDEARATASSSLAVASAGTWNEGRVVETAVMVLMESLADGFADRWRAEHERCGV